MVTTDSRVSNRRLDRTIAFLLVLLLGAGSCALCGCCGAKGSPSGGDDIPDPPTLTAPDLYAPVPDGGVDGSASPKGVRR